MIGPEETIFRTSRALYDEVGMEEERRLCYVGMTRARQELYLLHAGSRLLYGGLQSNPPSRFYQRLTAIFKTAADRPVCRLARRPLLATSRATYRLTRRATASASQFGPAQSWKWTAMLPASTLKRAYTKFNISFDAAQEALNK